MAVFISPESFLFKGKPYHIAVISDSRDIVFFFFGSHQSVYYKAAQPGDLQFRVGNVKNNAGIADDEPDAVVLKNEKYLFLLLIFLLI